MNIPSANVVSAAPADPGPEPIAIAISLLALEQRFKALDRLYNEEIAALNRELAQLKAEYVRLFHHTPARPRRHKAPTRR